MFEIHLAYYQSPFIFHELNAYAHPFEGRRDEEKIKMILNSYFKSLWPGGLYLVIREEKSDSFLMRHMKTVV